MSGVATRWVLSLGAGRLSDLLCSNPAQRPRHKNYVTWTCTTPCADTREHRSTLAQPHAGTHSYIHTFTCRHKATAPQATHVHVTAYVSCRAACTVVRVCTVRSLRVCACGVWAHFFAQVEMTRPSASSGAHRPRPSLKGTPSAMLGPHSPRARTRASCCRPPPVPGRGFAEHPGLPVQRSRADLLPVHLKREQTAKEGETPQWDAAPVGSETPRYGPLGTHRSTRKHAPHVLITWRSTNSGAPGTPTRAVATQPTSVTRSLASSTTLLKPGDVRGRVHSRQGCAEANPVTPCPA